MPLFRICEPANKTSMKLVLFIKNRIFNLSFVFPTKHGTTIPDIIIIITCAYHKIRTKPDSILPPCDNTEIQNITEPNVDHF